MDVLLNVQRVLASLALLICTMSNTASSAEMWQFKKIYESKAIIENSFVLATAADINSNGRNEIIATDFGWNFKSKANRDEYGFNIYVLEWEADRLNIKFHKKWKNISQAVNKEGGRYFAAFKARTLIPWKIDNKVIVETIPPYLSIQWVKNKYKLEDNQVWDRLEGDHIVGSWVFPWLSPHCYSGFVWQRGPVTKKIAQSKECLVGLRQFADSEDPKIVSVVTEESAKGKSYRQILRVRSLRDNFPIEWQQESNNFFGWWSQSSEDYIDPLNWKGSKEMLLFGYKPLSWYVLRSNDKNSSYELIDLHNSEPMNVKSYLSPYIYLRNSTDRYSSEYWGYDFIKSDESRGLAKIRKATEKGEHSGFNLHDVDIKTHDKFLGVSFFNLQDIDGDGLDEVFLIERTGERKSDGDEMIFSNIQEYIHVLKWNGRDYQTMWTSSPYSKLGTFLLIDDIMNKGKKQLIVLTPTGTIQIWEKQ